MVTTMDPKSKSITDNTENHKINTTNFIIRDGSLIVRIYCTGRSGDTPQKKRRVAMY